MERKILPLQIPVLQLQSLLLLQNKLRGHKRSKRDSSKPFELMERKSPKDGKRSVLRSALAPKETRASASNLWSERARKMGKDQFCGRHSHQKRLEQALRTYGAKEPERWEKISSAVGTRTKRECMLRFKELAEAMKAKKL